jgi:hypothetical protein
MTFKDEVKAKIPEDIQFTPEFKVFLKWLGEKGVQDTSQLRRFVAEEIKSHDSWLKTNRKSSVEGTMNRWLREHTRQLEFWKLIDAKVLKYL